MTAKIQRSFSGGEIAPSLYARADLVKYATGLRTCRNFAVARHGGVFNRPGSKYIAEVNDSTKTVRLIPWVFNADQSYVLEFGDLYMRVHRNGAQVTETAQNITGATNADPCVITIAGHGYSDGEEVYISGVGGMNELNGRNYKVANSLTNTFSLQYMNGTDVDSTGFTAYTSGGTASRVYTLTTPYVEADLQTLQFAQSADVMTLVHPSYAPRELTRTGHTSWSLDTITFGTELAPPESLSATGTAGGNTWEYVVTAVAEDTYEETTYDGPDGNGYAGPSEANPVSLTWDAVTGAVEYNVYRGKNGVYGFIGSANTNAFTDTGFTPDYEDTSPIARNPFSSSGNYPSTVSYFQQRRVFGNTDNNIETIWASKTGLPYNFMITYPTKDDDAITFTLAGKYVNGIRHLIEVNRLIVLTSGGEWAIEGDGSGVLLPTAINARQHAYNGASTTIPLIVNGTVVYVQARGTIIRDLGFDFSVDGYRGNDLTIFATHLFDSNTIRDWAYQQIPHSIAWVVRDDGILLGLTYIREHEVLAWHRHDFQGDIVEQVVTVPEGTQDALYLVIKRAGLGSPAEDRRYIERVLARRPDDVLDMTYMDSYLTYDGRNTGATTMTLTSALGDPTWGYDEELTLTASSSTFSASDVGNAVHLTDENGEIIRCTITTYGNNLFVFCRPHKTVPTTMRNVAITTWSMAVDEVGGLWHLEGKDVSVFADGFVVANPNNSEYETVTVSDGAITLDRPYGVIHVGLPITADFETLDIDTTQGETLADKKKLVNRVSLFVESSRGIWVGGKPPEDDTVDPLEGLVEMKLRDTEEYDDPTDLETGPIDINIQSEWNSNGRIFVRQVDPVPLAILAAVPTGLFPTRG